jgi:hypothetical protein
MNDSDKLNIPALRERMLAHLGVEADAYPKRLEQSYPRILARLVEIWGFPETDTYLSNLLVADRADRQGFPDDVAGELFRLSMIHDSLRLKESRSDGWTDSGATGVDASLDRRSSR